MVKQKFNPNKSESFQWRSVDDTFFMSVNDVAVITA